MEALRLYCDSNYNICFANTNTLVICNGFMPKTWMVLYEKKYQIVSRPVKTEGILYFDKKMISKQYQDIFTGPANLYLFGTGRTTVVRTNLFCE